MNQIVSANDPLLKQLLRDFRLPGGEVARVRGFGKFRSVAFPEFTSNEVLIETISKQELQLPSLFYRWLSACRLPYLMLSGFPLLLALASSLHQATLSIEQAIASFVSVVCLHLSVIFWTEYEDHIRGVDSPETKSGSKVIQQLWIPAIHLRNMAAVLFVSGIAIGCSQLFQIPFHPNGKVLILICSVCALLLMSFSGWPFHFKYFGLGEPVIFILTGPLATYAATLVLSSNFEMALANSIYALPLAFLAILKLHSGNMQRIPFDKNSRNITIAKIFGFFMSSYALVFLFLAPFLLNLSLVVFYQAPRLTLISWCLLPFLVIPIRKCLALSGPLDPQFTQIDRSIFLFHFLFGSFYCLSFL